MSQITEAQLRRAIRDQIIRTLSEGKEEAAETKYPLVKVLHRACDIFDDAAPEPSDGSDNKPTLQLGKRDGKVAFFVSGAMTRKGKQYPLLQKRDSSQHADPAYPSEAALRKAVIDAAAKAFSEHKMLDHFRTIDFGDLQRTELKSGLYGYVVPTSIPVRAKSKDLKEGSNGYEPLNPGSALQSITRKNRLRAVEAELTKTNEWFTNEVFPAVEEGLWPIVADQDYAIEFLFGAGGGYADTDKSKIYIKRGTTFLSVDDKKVPGVPADANHSDQTPLSLLQMYERLEDTVVSFNLNVPMQSFRD